MPPTETPPGHVATSEDVEKAAKAAGVSTETFKAALQIGAEASVQYVKEHIQPELDAIKTAAAAEAEARKKIEESLKQTDPSTRPGFSNKLDEPAAITKERITLEDGSVVKGWVLPTEAPVIQRAKRALPAGAGWKKVSYDDERSWLKGINFNESPPGDVEDNFSMARFARALFLQSKNGTYRGKNAPWETKWYDWVEKAQGEATGQDGGFLAPEAWLNQLFGIIRPISILDKLPITRLNVGTRVVHIPRITGDVVVSYAADNATLNPSQFQFSQSSLTIRKQYTFTQISNELLRDSLPAAEQAVRSETARAIALDRDKQFLLGNGQLGVPVGVVNQTNVGSGFTAADAGNGATPKYTDLRNAVYQVENLNGSTNVPSGQTTCTGVVSAVRLKTTIFDMVDSNGRPLWDWGIGGMVSIPPRGWLLDMDGSSQGYSPFNSPLGAGDTGLGSMAPSATNTPAAGGGAVGLTPGGGSNNTFSEQAGGNRGGWIFSNLIPTNLTRGASTTASQAIFGDWRWAILAERQDVEIAVSNVAGTAFQNDQTWLRFTYRYDVVVVHPEAFYVLNGILQ